MRKHQGAVLPHGIDHARVIMKQNRERIGAAHVLHCSINRSLGRADIAIFQIDQVRDTFRIRFAAKPISLLPQHFSEPRGIFQYAVMHQSERGGNMRMRIFLRGRAVRRPARMPDAADAARRILRLFDKPRNPARAPYAMHRAVFLRKRNSRGIIPAVFQGAKPLQKHLFCIHFSRIPDYSAHTPLSCFSTIHPAPFMIACGGTTPRTAVRG